ncbi:alpha/beta fold hydrolase [Phytomonospora sp. NPDC050363]|uniref:alpha/beta fold hydrolase n=1 Tax=Phytomonospora sp. NPDC050363 TaxID=3155642 RepID=UPI0033CDAB78
MTRRLLARIALGLLAVGLWPGSAAAYEPPGTAAWLADTVDGHPLPDPASASPADVAAFFAALAPETASDLARRHPGVVGNLDGAPLALRYEANERTAGLPGRQLLAYDPTGDGRIAEVVGDLATAERVAVIVPGVDTTLGNFHTGLGGRQERSPLWQARQVFEAAGDDRLAVIAWLGYDAPENGGLSTMSLIRSDRAESGGESLAGLLDGLALASPQATVTVIGHSYGSTVAAYAAPAFPAQVTDLVALGSPGMDVDTAAELGTNARVWAGLAADDPITNVPDLRVLGLGHGEDPADAEFGALRLDATGNSGHDGYFVPGATVLRGLTAIIESTRSAA